MSKMSVVVEQGTYVWGDPCYALTYEDWDALLDSCGHFESAVGELKGQKVYALPTKFGDGMYSDSLGREIPVDSGLIGLVPTSLASRKPKYTHIVKIDEPTVFSVDDDGVIMLGDILFVHTGEDVADSYEYEDDDEYEGDDESWC